VADVRTKPVHFTGVVKKKFEVLVSKRVQTDQNIPEHMMTLAYRPIFKPQGQNF